MTHVHQTRAADLQHGLRLKNLLGLLERTASVVSLGSDPDPDVVAIGFHHFDQCRVEYVLATVRFGNEPLIPRRNGANPALQPCNEDLQRGGPVRCRLGAVAPANALQRAVEAFVVEGFQQVVRGAHAEGLERVLIVSGHEYDLRQCCPQLITV